MWNFKFYMVSPETEQAVSGDICFICNLIGVANKGLFHHHAITFNKKA